MRTYCERYRFQHPKPKQFYDVVLEVAEADGKGNLGWIVGELFETDQGFDYGIGSISSEELP